MYVFGDNTYGNLGLGDFEERDEPVLVESLSEAATYGIKVKEIVVGDNHCLALMTIEEEETLGQMVFGWGSNEFSQLGSQDSGEEPAQCMNVPFQVLKSFSQSISSISSLSNYASLVSELGEVSQDDSGLHMGQRGLLKTRLFSSFQNAKNPSKTGAFSQDQIGLFGVFPRLGFERRRDGVLVGFGGERTAGTR